MTWERGAMMVSVTHDGTSKVVTVAGLVGGGFGICAHEMPIPTWLAHELFGPEAKAHIDVCVLIHTHSALGMGFFGDLEAAKRAAEIASGIMGPCDDLTHETQAAFAEAAKRVVAAWAASGLIPMNIPESNWALWCRPGRGDDAKPDGATLQ